MTRRELRENVFLLLFRAEFHNPTDMKEQLSLFDEASETLKNTDPEETIKLLNDKDRTYIEHKVEDILSKIDLLDSAINEAADGWKTSRMGKVDLTLIRLAVYEIKFEEEIPFKVSVNEAVELAKHYGADNSASFVNGVLHKFEKESAESDE
ncbi:MAG: transcription antitermination factor NusB [Lachnospiraceae bacterium]|jgi:N utilization substance protein B|nr:transcription antitermination factor NusB [Lachnospiraceae bacterium]